MDRAEHLQWCKNRALDYLPDDSALAFASMVTDMRKHKELESHGALTLMTQLMFAGALDTPAEMEKFIKGFN